MMTIGCEQLIASIIWRTNEVERRICRYQIKLFLNQYISYCPKANAAPSPTSKSPWPWAVPTVRTSTMIPVVSAGRLNPPHSTVQNLFLVGLSGQVSFALFAVQAVLSRDLLPCCVGSMNHRPRGMVFEIPSSSTIDRAAFPKYCSFPREPRLYLWWKVRTECVCRRCRKWYTQRPKCRLATQYFHRRMLRAIEVGLAYVISLVPRSKRMLLQNPWSWFVLSGLSHIGWVNVDRRIVLIQLCKVVPLDQEIDRRDAIPGWSWVYPNFHESTR